MDSTYGHLQPQALELERVVLGALMIDKDAFTVVSEMLRPDTFYEPRNQKVYTAIQTLNMAEKPVDIMTVTEELRHEGELQNIGGPGYIVELSSHVASSAHIEYHARILQQKYLARQLISFASMVETEAFDETVDVDALMQKAEGGLFELSQRNMMQDYTQIDPVIKQAHDILLKAANNTGGLTGVPTGYTKLDEMTAGWQQSDLIIIAGRPAMGKTSFALSIAKNIAIDYRKPVAFFSLEMNNVQLINRLISNVCEVPGSKILSGQLSEDEWVRFDKRLPQMQGAPLYVDDTPGLSVFELRTKARRLKREHDIQLLMIDYLQLMNANGMRFNSRQEEVSTISRSLKGLGQGTGYSHHRTLTAQPYRRATRRTRWQAPTAQRPSRVGCHRAGCRYGTLRTPTGVLPHLPGTATGRISVDAHRSSLPSTVRVRRVMCCSTSRVNTLASPIPTPSTQNLRLLMAKARSWAAG